MYDEVNCLSELSAPELKAQSAAAESTLRQAEADTSQAEAQAAAVESTFARLEEALKTPGAIAGNESVQVEKQRDAARALIESRKAATRAAEERLRATKETEAYLRVAAPFDGTITDRFVHPGMLVKRMLTRLCSNCSRIRISPNSSGARGLRWPCSTRRDLTFHVASQPGKTYTARIARVSSALDLKAGR